LVPDRGTQLWLRVLASATKMDKPTIDQDEYLDLVDENDNVIGKKKRSEVYAEHLSNFRVVNAFVVNSKGEIWIPRRTANKRIFPLCLDISMGGHVESGESYENMLKRETQEELNIDIDKIPYRLLDHLTPQKDNVSAHMNVYEIKMDETPDYNKTTLPKERIFMIRHSPFLKKSPIKFIIFDKRDS